MLAGGAVVVAALSVIGAPSDAAAPHRGATARPAAISAHASGTGSISGTVTTMDSGSSSPVSGACISAETSGGTVEASTTSAADGTYTLATVAAGSYVVAFTACTSANYVTQYYDSTTSGALQISGATTVSVTAGVTTPGIDAVMILGGSITGTVTDAGGSGLAGICASAIASGEPSLGSTPTTSSGTYTIAGVPTDGYAVEFYACSTSANYVTQYYDSTTSGALQISGATTVSVTAGVTTLGIDAVMVLGGSITGTVTDAGGAAVAGACVTASTTSGVAGTATSDATGAYTVSGLATGSYTVFFSGCTSTSASYVSQYYDGTTGGVSTSAAALAVAVYVGSTTSGIDATLAAGGTISGTVTNAAGSAVGGECVSVDSLSAGLGGAATTASDGTYAVTGLAAGNYVVEFLDCTATGYADQYYDGVAGGTPAYQSAEVLTVAAGSTATANASLVLGGSISGTVTASDSGVAGVCVLAATADGSSVGQAQTTASGTYTIAGLSAGSYVVSFSDCGGAGDYAPQYYDGVTGGAATYGAATAVSVTAGQTTSSIDAVMAAGGAISGTVTNAASSGVAGICVDAIASDGALGANATTGTDGTYLLSGLAAGTYILELTDCNTPATYATGYYAASSVVDTLAQAAAVSVTAGQTTSGIDAVMAAGGSISGTVVDATTAQAVSGICVSAYGVSADVGATAVSASDGTYSLSGLPAGDYIVSFSPCAPGSPYASEYYNGSASGTTSWGLATPLSVGASTPTTGIDAAMELGGSITGTITDATSGSPVAGVCAQAQSAASWSPPVPSSPTGTYRISGLSAGTYSVYFFDCGTLGNYAAQYYTGAPGGSPSSATGITVTPGSTISGIDATMVLGGNISGTVTTTTSGTTSGISGICVSAIGQGGQSMSTAVTLADGSFEIVGLAPGGYVVVFQVCGNTPAGTSYVSQFYNATSTGSPTYNGATTVKVTASVTTSGINAALVVGGSISGTVTDTNGAGIGQICVVALTPQGQWVATGMTLGGGTYVVTGLPTGSYVVEFEECGNLGSGLSYVSQYYNKTPAGAPQFSGATPVSVTAGSTTSGIDAAMVLGGTISGMVTTTTTSGTSSGVSGICVLALTTQGQWVASAETLTDGTYNLAGLPSGSYDVSFQSCGPSSGTGYVTQYYNGAATLTGATSVSVTAGNTTPNINAALQAGGAISGTVTTTTSGTTSGISGICVDAFTSGASGGQFVASTQSAASGTYTLAGLASGSYDVSFQSCGPSSGTGYVTQYYNGVATLTGATSVSVTAGSTTSGIDAVMVLGGAISGTVTDASTGQGIGGICVDAFTSGASGGQFVAGTQSAASGTYNLAGLPSGSYDVSFQSCDPSAPTSYVTQYYNGAATLTGATSVSVTVGQTASGIDATMVLSGNISGTVTTTTSGTTSGISGICVDAFTSGASGGQFVAGTQSAASGTYVLAGLASGSYDVSFQSCDPSAPTSYVTQYYNGTSAGASQFSMATPVSVTVGSPTQSIDAVLVVGASISGTVTDASTGQGIGGICVTLTPSGSTGGSSLVTLDESNGTYDMLGVPAGSYTVSFQECDGGSSYVTQYYNGAANLASAATVSVTAGSTYSGIDAAMLLAQTVAFTSPAPSSPTVGTTYTPTATASSGLAVTFAIDGASTANACSVSSGVVSFTLAGGTCVIDAIQAGNASYAPAEASQSVTIAGTLTAAVRTPLPGRPGPQRGAPPAAHGSQLQTVTFSSPAPSSPTVGTTYTPTATASSGLAVTFTIDGASTPGVCTWSAGSVSFTGAGTCVIDANQAGNATYASASAQQTLTVGAGSQTVAFSSPAPSSPTVGTTYTPTATASSGLPVAFAVDAASTPGACTLGGGAVSFTGTGTCVIDALQAGNASYLAAPLQSQAMTVTRGSQTLRFASAAPFPIVVGLTTYTPFLIASSGLAATLSVDAASTPGTCVVVGPTVFFRAPGTCLLDATQAGDAQYLAAPEALQQVIVPAPPTVFPPVTAPPVAVPPVAVPPVVVPGLASSAYGAPTSIDVGSAGGQVTITLASGIVVTVTAPPGALPTGTSLSLYDVAPSGLGSLVPAGTSVLGGVALSWQVPTGSPAVPAASLQVSAHGGGLAAGDLVGTVVSGTWSLLATLSGLQAAVPVSGDQVLAFVSPPSPPPPALTVAASHGPAGHPLTLATSGGSPGAAVTFRLLGPGSARCRLSGSQVVAGRAGTCRVVAAPVGPGGPGAWSGPTTLVFFPAATAMPLVRAVRGALAPRGAVSRIVIVGRGFVGRPVVRVPSTALRVRVVSDSGTALVLRVDVLRALVARRLRLTVVFAGHHLVVVTVPVR